MQPVSEYPILCKKGRGVERWYDGMQLLVIQEVDKTIWDHVSWRDDPRRLCQGHSCNFFGEFIQNCRKIRDRVEHYFTRVVEVDVHSKIVSGLSGVS